MSDGAMLLLLRDAADARDAGEQLQNATSKSLSNFNGIQPASRAMKCGWLAVAVAFVVVVVVAVADVTRVPQHFAQ